MFRNTSQSHLYAFLRIRIAFWMRSEVQLWLMRDVCSFQITKAQRFLFVLTLCIFVLQAHANEGRYQDYATGARAIGLGGAFGALSDDASGVFYNPAGLVDIRRTRVSISTSLYGLEFQGSSPLNSAVIRLERGVSAADLIILPAATGGVWGFKQLPNGSFKHAFAFSTQVPGYTSRSIQSEETSPVNNRISYLRSTLNDRLLYGGLGYAYRGTPWLRFGVGLHYVFRTVDAEESFTTLSPQDSARFAYSQSRLRATYHGLRGNFGVKLRLHPRWSFGITLTTPSLGLWRSTLIESISINALNPSSNTPLEPNSIRIDKTALDLQSRDPATLRLAMAYSQRDNFTFAFDLIFYSPSSYEIIPQEEVQASPEVLSRIPLPLKIERSPLMNANIGFEKMINPHLSISAGLFTNFSASPDLKEEDGFLTDNSSRLSNIDMIGFSFSLGFFGENALSRLGVTGSSGYGKLVRASAPDDRLFEGRPPLSALPAAQTFLFLYWSSTFRFGENERVRGFSL